MLGEPEQHNIHMQWHENLFRCWNIIIDETHAHDNTISPPFSIMNLYKNCTQSHHCACHKGMWGSTVQLILNLGSWNMWVDNFTSWGNNPGNHSIGDWIFQRREKSFTTMRNQIPEHPAQRLYQVQYPCSWQPNSSLLKMWIFGPWYLPNSCPKQPYILTLWPWSWTFTV